MNYNIIFNKFNETIDNTIAYVYHRTVNSKIIDSFNNGEEFKAGKGDYYGVGMYAALDLETANTKTLRYGPIMIKFRVPCLKKYFCFDYDKYMEIHTDSKASQDSFIKEQLLNFGYSESSAEKINNQIKTESYKYAQKDKFDIVADKSLSSIKSKADNSINKYTRSDIVFSSVKDLWKASHLDDIKKNIDASYNTAQQNVNDFMKSKGLKTHEDILNYINSKYLISNPNIAGIIYMNGNNDGNVLVTYKQFLLSLTPIMWKKDNGEWKNFALPKTSLDKIQEFTNQMAAMPIIKIPDDTSDISQILDNGKNEILKNLNNINDLSDINLSLMHNANLKTVMQLIKKYGQHDFTVDTVYINNDPAYNTFEILKNKNVTVGKFILTKLSVDTLFNIVDQYPPEKIEIDTTMELSGDLDNFDIKKFESLKYMMNKKAIKLSLIEKKDKYFQNKDNLYKIANIYKNIKEIVSISSDTILLSYNRLFDTDSQISIHYNDNYEKGSDSIQNIIPFLKMCTSKNIPLCLKTAFYNEDKPNFEAISKFMGTYSPNYNDTYIFNFYINNIIFIIKKGMTLSMSSPVTPEEIHLYDYIINSFKKNGMTINY